MSKPIPYGQGVTFCHLTSCGNCSAYAAGDSHKPYGVDGLFPVQRTAVIIEPFGTDKSVPYAHDWLISYILINLTLLVPLNADNLKCGEFINFS